MRIDSELLKIKALCALDQVATECEAGPLRQSVALRFALAYLSAVGKGDGRHFDDFWRVICDPLDWAQSSGQAERYRGSYARSALHGTARSVGYPKTPKALERLTVWRKTTPR